MNSGKTTRKPPESFLALRGYGPAQLATLLAGVDWSRDDAFGRARASLALFTATIAELLRIEARARRVKLASLLAALARENAPEELPLLGLALAEMEITARVPGLTARLRATLAEAAKPLSVHARLLREGSVPAARLGDLAPVDGDTRLAVLARQEFAAGTAAPRIAVELLKLAERDASTRGVLLRRIRLARKMLGDTRYALDHRTFRSLPVALRELLLFTPDLQRAFLEPQAQAAARPPSPGFDPLFLKHALAELRRGRLGHVELDTLFLGAASAKFRAGIVEALAEGAGDLNCADDVRERLLANAQTAEFCLLACAVARNGDETRRAMQQLTSLPGKGVLGDALRGFAAIAWRDALPSELPPHWRSRPDFCREIFEDSIQQLLACLRGDATRLPPAPRFRQFTAWLACIADVAPPAGHGDAGRSGLNDLVAALYTQGQALANDIDGNDLYALYGAGPAGPQLAITLAETLREHNRARWKHGFFTRLVDLDPAVALTLVGNEPDGTETEILGMSAPANKTTDDNKPGVADEFMDIGELFQ